MLYSPAETDEKCEDQACLSPSELTIVVAVGNPLEIRFGSKGIYPCENNDQCPDEKILMTDEFDCTLDFDRGTGQMTRGDFTGSDTSCETLRTDNWRATTNNPPGEDDVFLRIESAHPDDRYLEIDCNSLINLVCLLILSGEWVVIARKEVESGMGVIAHAHVWVGAGEEDIHICINTF